MFGNIGDRPMTLWAYAGNDIDSKWQEWHLESPGPILQASSMTFQADGDELQVILQALKAVGERVNGLQGR